MELFSIGNHHRIGTSLLHHLLENLLLRGSELPVRPRIVNRHIRIDGIRQGGTNSIAELAGNGERRKQNNRNDFRDVRQTAGTQQYDGGEDDQQRHAERNHGKRSGFGAIPGGGHDVGNQPVSAVEQT